MKADELVEAILVPRLRAFEYVFPFKQARRQEDDISIVTSGTHIYLAPGFDKSVFITEDASLAFGGMAPTTAIALKTTGFLVGKELCRETFDGAQSVLQAELDLPDRVPGGQARYCKAFASSFLLNFFLQVLDDDLVVLDEGIDVPNGKTLPSALSIEDAELGALESFLSDV